MTIKTGHHSINTVLKMCPQ